MCNDLLTNAEENSLPPQVGKFFTKFKETFNFVRTSLTEKNVNMGVLSEMKVYLDDFNDLVKLIPNFDEAAHT